MQKDAWRGTINENNSLNRYDYCYNNPIKYSDKGGNRPVETATVSRSTPYYAPPTPKPPKVDDYSNSSLGIDNTGHALPKPDDYSNSSLGINEKGKAIGSSKE